MEYKRATQRPYASDFAVGSPIEVKWRIHADYEYSDAIIDEDTTR